MKDINLNGVPETIEVRGRFLEEKERVSMHGISAMDESWAKVIEPAKGAVLVVIEGLTMYLTEEDVKQILTIIDKNFNEVQVIMETMNPFVVKHIKEKSIEASEAGFTWGIKNGNEIERMIPAFKWVKDISLVEGMKVMYPVYHLFGWIPIVKNISNKLVILKKNGQVNAVNA